MASLYMPKQNGFQVLLGLLVAVVAASAETSVYKADYAVLDGQRVHRVKFEVEATNDIVQLDGLTGLDEIKCEVLPAEDVMAEVEALPAEGLEALSEVNVTFSSNADRKRFTDALENAKRFDDALGHANKAFVTSKDASHCDEGILMRRVWKVDSPACAEDSQCTAVLSTSRAQYAELIKNGVINITSEDREHVSAEDIESLEKDAAAGLGSARHGIGYNRNVCLGINVQKGPWHGGCNAKRDEIELYTSGFGWAGFESDFRLVCKECFAGISATVFFQAQFDLFHLKFVEAGLKQASVDVSLGLNAHSTSDNSFANVDKEIWRVPRLELFRFNIGPIPFVAHFDGNARVKATIGCNSRGSVDMGVKARHVIGNDYWTWRHGRFTHSKSHPRTEFAPILAGKNGDFECRGNAALLATAKVTFNDLAFFQTSSGAHMDLSMHGVGRKNQGDGKWHVCSQVTPRFMMQASGGIDARLGFFHIREMMPPTTWLNLRFPQTERCIGNDAPGPWDSSSSTAEELLADSYVV